MGAAIIRLVPLSLGVWVACIGAACAQGGGPPPLKPVATFQFTADLKDDDGDPAKDVSGIACLPPAGAGRTCLMINDEDRSAQFVRIEGQTVTPGARLRLVGDGPSNATVGTRPTDLSCSDGEGKFKEFDGEAVAYAAPYFYVAGSHGCSRNKNRFRLSSFILVRVRVDGEGRVVGADGSPAADPASQVASTYRLADVLRTTKDSAQFYGKDLSADGVNIEGLAVVGGRLVAGLRAPNAILVSVDVEHLFASGARPARPAVMALPLNKTMGVRDIAPLDGNRVLVLFGPTREQKSASGIALVDIAAKKTTVLATLEPVVEGNTTGKPEGLVVLGEAGGTLRVAVLFDSLRNGGMREYAVPLK